jgi:hypothetical protein
MTEAKNVSKNLIFCTNENVFVVGEKIKWRFTTYRKFNGTVQRQMYRAPTHIKTISLKFVWLRHNNLFQVFEVGDAQIIL